MWDTKDALLFETEELSTMIDTSDNLDFNIVTYAELGDIDLVESCLSKASEQSKEKALCKAIIKGNLDIVKLILGTGINPLVHDALALNLAVTKYDGNTSIIRAILDKSPSVNSILANQKIRDGTVKKEKEKEYINDNYPISKGGFNRIDKNLIINQKEPDKIRTEISTDFNKMSNSITPRFQLSTPISERNMLISAGPTEIGISTQAGSLRNANNQIRSETHNSTKFPSIWNLPTITPDLHRKPLEISDDHLSILPLNAIFDKSIYDLATKLATKKGYIDVVELLLNKGVNICNDLLLLASESGHLDIIELLFDKFTNIDINYFTNMMVKVKGVATQANIYPLKMAIENNHVDVVNYLIEKKAELGTNNDEPLLMALRKGHGDIVKILLSANKNSELIGLLKESLAEEDDNVSVCSDSSLDIIN